MFEARQNINSFPSGNKPFASQTAELTSTGPAIIYFDFFTIASRITGFNPYGTVVTIRTTCYILFTQCICVFRIILTKNSDYFFVRHSNAKWLLCELYGCHGSTMNNIVLRDVLGAQPGSFETLQIYNTPYGATPQKTALEYSGYFIQKFRLVSACCGVVQC
jgi:hypothetical protein